MHSSLLVSCAHSRVMLDCGADWVDELALIAPDAIILTHAHSDHSLGLANGAPCPVYATEDTWKLLERLPISIRRLVAHRTPFALGPLSFKAVPVTHSPVAPAVGYRISAEGSSLFYVPDVLRIADPRRDLQSIDLYIGDGARLEHALVRGRDERMSGHASIREQLSWCAAAEVRRAIFTHCGTAIIVANEAEAQAALNGLACSFDVEASFARDGEQISVGPKGVESNTREGVALRAPGVS